MLTSRIVSRWNCCTIGLLGFAITAGVGVGSAHVGVSWCVGVEVIGVVGIFGLVVVIVRLSCLLATITYCCTSVTYCCTSVA